MRLWMAQANPSPWVETLITEAILTRGHQHVTRQNFVCEDQIVYSGFAGREDLGIFCQWGSITLRWTGTLHLAGT